MDSVVGSEAAAEAASSLVEDSAGRPGEGLAEDPAAGAGVVMQVGQVPVAEDMEGHLDPVMAAAEATTAALPVQATEAQRQETVQQVATAHQVQGAHRHAMPSDQRILTVFASQVRSAWRLPWRRQ